MLIFCMEAYLWLLVFTGFLFDSICSLEYPVSVEVGKEHACAIMNDYSLKSWGANSGGQLGLGHTQAVNIPALVDLGSGNTVKSISLGREHTCAIIHGGTVKCWGNNGGRLGTGNTTSMTRPVTIDLGAGLEASQISAGNSHTCVVFQNGALKCWGYLYLPYNDLDPDNAWCCGLGDEDGEMGDNLPFITFDSGHAVKTVIAGDSDRFTCAVLEDDSLWCWGKNEDGSLGISGGDRTVPTKVLFPGGRTVKSVSSTNGYCFSCVILNDGTVWCWGRNDYGQMANGDGGRQYRLGQGWSEAQDVLTPLQVDFGSPTPAEVISLGTSHACVIFQDFSVSCWGGNHNTNRLGTKSDGSKASTSFQDSPFGPIDFGMNRKAKQISLGSYNTCVILDNDSLVCFGSNSRGQLGIGHFEEMQELSAVDFTAQRSPPPPPPPPPMVIICTTDQYDDGSACLACPTYSSSTGGNATSCSCAANTYASKTGNTWTCANCTDGTTKAAGSVVPGTGGGEKQNDVCSASSPSQKAKETKEKAETTRDTMLDGVTDAKLKKKAKLLADAAISGKKVRKMSAKLTAPDADTACSDYYTKAGLSSSLGACIATAAPRRRSLAATTYDVSVFFSEAEVDEGTLTSAANSLKAEGVTGVETSDPIDPITELGTIDGVDSSTLETFKTEASAAAALMPPSPPPPPISPPPPGPPVPNLIQDDDDHAAHTRGLVPLLVISTLHILLS
mmetsp:Transcript_7877/g.35745  ORF Transcript_7877/g.35745 Transcript_7877/m.35745 type:complete len:729 (+) Transcript_7877:216-2402(+)